MTALRLQPDGAQTQAERLRALAVVVRRLVPDRTDPERFHRDKSEVEAALRRLAAEIERSAR